MTKLDLMYEIEALNLPIKSKTYANLKALKNGKTVFNLPMANNIDKKFTKALDTLGVSYDTFVNSLTFKTKIFITSSFN